MAISFAHVGAGLDDSNSASYTIEGLALTANRVAVLGLLSFDAGGLAASPTTLVDSLGNLWSKAGEGLGGTNAMSAWVAHITNGGTADLELTYGISHEGIVWDVSESADIDASDPVVQFATNSGGTGTAGSLNLAAFADTDNAAWGMVQHGQNEGTTAGSGFTELGDTNGFLQPPATAPRGVQTQWKLNDNTLDWTWATTGSGWRAIGIEFRQGSSASGLSVSHIPSQSQAFALSVAGVGGVADPTFHIGAMCGGGACNAGDSDPDDPMRVVTWGDLGGPWYSEDGGLSFDRCAGGINNKSPENTGGAVEWSNDPDFPDRVWALTSGGFMVSNTWPPRWNVFATGVQGGEHGQRPRQVGGMIHDTGHGIVYVCSPTAIRRYDVPAGSGGANSNGFTIIANSGFAGANAITADPNDDGRVWIATSSGVYQIDNADTRTGPGAVTAVGGLSGQAWDVDAVSLNGTTYLWVAANTNKVRRYVPSTGTTLTFTGLPAAQYCAIDAQVVGGAIHVIAGTDDSVQTGGNFQQYFRTTNGQAATVGAVTWTCISLDNADMQVLETEGPAGEPWVGYRTPATGGSFGNRLRDHSTHTAHDLVLHPAGRYAYAFTTGGCYRFDFNLRHVFPAMHNLGTTTNSSIRAHPTNPLLAMACNTDHWTLYSEDGGDTWLKAEIGDVPQGTVEASTCCFDDGHATRTYSGGGNRGANNGGGFFVNPNPFNNEAWATLGWPANVGTAQNPVRPQAIGSDARRIGSTVHVMVASRGDSVWRYSHAAANPLSGTWTRCSGSAFTGGGSILNADVRWASDSVVWAYDRDGGVFRCTNPTAATPSWTQIVADSGGPSERDGFLRVISETEVVISRGNAAFRVFSNGTTQEIRKPGGASFARASIMEVIGDVIYMSEGKPDSGADAALYRGTGNTLSEDITDTWFAENLVKESDMVATCDGSRLLFVGRGGGIGIGELDAVSTPSSQTRTLSAIASGSVMHPIAVATPDPPPVAQAVSLPTVPAGSVHTMTVGEAETQFATLAAVAATSEAFEFAAENETTTTIGRVVGRVRRVQRVTGRSRRGTRMTKRFQIGEVATLEATTSIGDDITDPGISGEVTLIITAPDGTVETRTHGGGTVTEASNGVFTADVLLDSPGQWTWRWVVTGDVTGADAGELLVGSSL